MASGFAVKDLDSFFEIGVHVDGVKALITDGASFTREVAGVFSLASQDAPIYGETSVDADDPSIECKSTDLVGVKRGMSLTMPELEAHEDGYGKNYRIVRISGATGSQTTRMFLKEI